PLLALPAVYGNRGAWLRANTRFWPTVSCFGIRCLQPPITNYPLPFILEGDLNLGAVALDLAVLEHHVELRYLRDAQVAQCLRRPLGRHGGSFFPGLGSGSRQLDHFVDACCHASLLVVLRWSLSRMHDLTA